MATIGIDLGGTKIQSLRLAAVDGAPADAPADLAARADGGDYAGPVGGGFEVTGHGRVPTPRVGGPEAVADAVAGIARDAGIEPGEAVGIGFAGPIDSANGVVLSAPNVPGFGERVPFAQMVSDRLDGAPVIVDNDVNVGVFGEWRLGAAKGSSDVLGVFLGTGVGGGLVLDGKLRNGPHGLAGEIGHTIVKVGGRKTGVGIRGVVEAYAGRAAMEAEAHRRHADGGKTKLFKIAEKKGKDRLTSSIWRKAFQDGDALTVSLIERAEEMVGVAIASAVNLLDLELVLLGGGVAEEFGQPMVDAIAAHMRKNLLVPDAAPKVVLGTLGDLAGGLGAALLAAERTA